MQRNFYLVWFILAVVNLIFAVAGRGNLYYLITALFLAAGIIARRSRTNQ